MEHDIKAEIAQAARSAGALPPGEPLTAAVYDLVDRVVQACALVADQGGTRNQMIGAITEAVVNESRGLRNLAALITHRCATIAELHGKAEEEGPGEAIRIRYAELEFGE